VTYVQKNSFLEIGIVRDQSDQVRLWDL